MLLRSITFLLILGIGLFFYNQKKTNTNSNFSLAKSLGIKEFQKNNKAKFENQNRLEYMLLQDKDESLKAKALEALLLRPPSETKLQKIIQNIQSSESAFIHQMAILEMRKYDSQSARAIIWSYLANQLTSENTDVSEQIALEINTLLDEDYHNKLIQLLNEIPINSRRGRILRAQIQEFSRQNGIAL